MEDQYGMADLRQYMNGRTHFPVIPPPADLYSSHRNLAQAQHYDMVMVGRQVSDMVPRGLHDFRSDSTNTTPTASVTGASNASLNGLEMEAGGALGGDGGTGRWPRQETLTLLEIRSRLDSKFKEANQKGPLWDEVSRIMSDEHGYQRSGKKCREKFENLYKYYKKTKEGKAGRQDGKHYRFFRQLEALYGETSNPVSASETHLVGNSFRFHHTTAQPNQDAFQAPKLSESLSLSSSPSEFDSSSSDDNDVNAAVLMDNDSMEKRKKRRGKRSWKAKIKDFIDVQMRKLMEKQEAWLEKMMKTIERKEQERMLREDEWKKEEASRMDREHKFWANERAWIEARDAALMDALQKLTGKELKAASSPEELMLAELRSLSENQNENGSHETITNTAKIDSWAECEITRLIQLRTSMESRFEQAGGCGEEVLWEEIAAKMACLGYDRSASVCKDKWDSINNYLRKTKECNKKRKENSGSSCYFQNNESIYNQAASYDGVPSPSNSNAGNVIHDSCFRFLMGDHGENLWENYGVKLSKGKNH